MSLTVNEYFLLWGSYLAKTKTVFTCSVSFQGMSQWTDKNKCTVSRLSFLKKLALIYFQGAVFPNLDVHSKFINFTLQIPFENPVCQKVKFSESEYQL